MAQERMNREQFFGKLSSLDDDALRIALWTLYWRGTAAMRAKIEAAIDPQAAKEAAAAKALPPDAASVLRAVQNFTDLARHGAYLSGDRRVSPKERTRWRYEFRDLASAAQDALRGDQPDVAAKALALMVDLACDLRDFMFFRSDDPVAAARFVVSDAVEALWLAMRRLHGADGFLAEAVPQLVRWESLFGWTMRGEGSIRERETSLAGILSRLLETPDMWASAAELYVKALDAIPLKKASRWDDVQYRTHRRAADLSLWNDMLLERLTEPDDAPLVERIVTHPALEGPQRTFLQAKVALRQGRLADARSLIQSCLKSLPGHGGFRDFAGQVGVTAPEPGHRPPTTATR